MDSLQGWPMSPDEISQHCLCRDVAPGQWHQRQPTPVALQLRYGEEEATHAVRGQARFNTTRRITERQCSTLQRTCAKRLTFSIFITSTHWLRWQGGMHPASKRPGLRTLTKPNRALKRAENTPRSQK
eukprot:355524-Chlamydomonas_euryale.AAC.18